MRRRVLLAPENPAGVATALRDGLRRRGHAADLVVFTAHPFGYAHDRVAGTYAQRIREVARTRRYDVAHYQFGTTLAEFLDVPVARRAIRLMHYWGDDARTLRAAARRHPARARVVATDPGHERMIERRLRLAGRLCHAALVSDLELAGYAAERFRRVYVVPTPLAPPPAPAALPPLPGEGPIVLHAPSHAVVKGTREIVPAIDRVAERRPLRRRLVSGVPHAQVLAEIARADVVVDQLNSETSGVFALEAMALGRPVLLEYRRDALAPFARETPLVPVTAATLEAELERLCADAGLRHRLGEAGRRFVAEVHDADRVAAAVEHVYDHVRGAAPGLYAATADGVSPLPSTAA